ncbi:MAG: hypothetical protein WBE58_20460 [Verrucomicrobiales bacterium]
MRESEPTGLFAFLNQFPERFRLAELLIFGKRQFRPEQKILQCILVQYPMNNHRPVRDFKIDPQIFGPVAVQFAAFPFDLAKPFPIQFLKVLGPDLEFRKHLKLRHGRELGDFCGADLVENDLKHGPTFGVKTCCAKEN